MPIGSEYYFPLNLIHTICGIKCHFQCYLFEYILLYCRGKCYIKNTCKTKFLLATLELSKAYYRDTISLSKPLPLMRRIALGNLS